MVVDKYHKVVRTIRRCDECKNVEGIRDGTNIWCRVCFPNRESLTDSCRKSITNDRTESTEWEAIRDIVLDRIEVVVHRVDDVHHSTYGQLRLQDSMTHSEIILFHDSLLVTITVIRVSVVVYFLVTQNTRLQPLHIRAISSLDTASEMVWTTVPLFILCSLGIPSLALLYKLEYIGVVDLTYKVVRHQWYWSYRHRQSSIDSYIVGEPSLGDLRLLDVDNRLSVPFNADVRLIVTSTDVIHAFSLPNFFVKCDAVPRRLNTSYLSSDVPRLAYGQCSEICRINHSFMPICFEFVDWASFLESVARW